jgi:hypothetical protein
MSCRIVAVSGLGDLFRGRPRAGGTVFTADGIGSLSSGMGQDGGCARMCVIVRVFSVLGFKKLPM